MDCYVAPTWAGARQAQLILLKREKVGLGTRVLGDSPRTRLYETQFRVSGIVSENKHLGGTCVHLRRCKRALPLRVALQTRTYAAGT